MRATAGGTWFFLYPTEPAGRAGHTLAQFHVADVATEVAELEAKGVTLDTYELPGVTWDGVIASLGDMGKAAWLKDSENNVLGIDDAAGM